MALPFADGAFDFATGFMSFMDVPETDRVLAEAYRVLKPGGFLQFSICHPCFDTPHRRNLRDAAGRTYAIEVGDYFRNLEGEVTEWLFKAAPPEAKAGLPKFRTPRFTRTLSQWLNLLIDAGFRLERLAEPRPERRGGPRPAPTCRTPRWSRISCMSGAEAGLRRWVWGSSYGPSCSLPPRASPACDTSSTARRPAREKRSRASSCAGARRASSRWAARPASRSGGRARTRSR